MKLRMPHTFVLLFALVVLAAVATHFIPAGEYRRVEKDGRMLVVPDSFHQIANSPAGIGDVFLAYPRGLVDVAHIVFYIFLIGGTFGIITATGAVESLISALVRATRGRGALVIPVLLSLFSLAGGTIGMAEEVLPFLPILVLLARRLGYDEVVGGAIALVGAGAGFSGAFLNPFTIGVGQGIAGLPLFSGLGYRLIVWAILTAVSAVYLSLYARRIRGRQTGQVAVAATEGPRISWRQKLVLLLFVGALATIVVGALRWQWGIMELAALFIALAILTGIAGGLGANAIAEKFLEGTAGIAGAALVVGLARGMLVIFDHAHVTDTILHGMSGAVAGLPAAASVIGIYGVQIVLNYLVPSGSGQAAISLPILAPLADLVGVTRQTSVLAYQFGDGMSNVFAPTSGYFMAGLSLIDVPWTRWARFMWPLECIWLATGLVLLLIAHHIRFGPF